jgi:hypothetical protein
MTPARQLVEQGRGLFGELGRSPRVSFSTATPTGRRSPLRPLFEDETGRLMATHRLTRDEAIPSTSPKCAAQKPLK